MNTVDFSKNTLVCKFSNKFSQIILFNTYSNNHNVLPKDKQEKSTSLINSFSKNFFQTSIANNIALNNNGNNFGGRFSESPNESYRSKMMRKIIANVSSLDGPIRLAFDMHHNGYNYNEIATCFNISLETVKERITYAKKVVREAILENCIDYQSLR